MFGQVAGGLVEGDMGWGGYGEWMSVVSGWLEEMGRRARGGWEFVGRGAG